MVQGMKSSYAINAMKIEPIRFNRASQRESQ